MHQVQALADILHSALCCHSNETRAPVANLPNSAQLGAPIPFSQVSSDRKTDAVTQMCATNIGLSVYCVLQSQKYATEYSNNIV